MRKTLKAFNAYSNLGLAEKPTLFVEFHGTEAYTREQVELFGEIAAELGGGPFDWATKEEDRNKLWQARHDGWWAIKAAMPGKGRARHRRVRAHLAARRMRRGNPQGP
jgi:D-lactate dehydrogenase (cytochrome)